MTNIDNQDIVAHSMSEFKRFFFPQEFLYQCRVQFAAKNGLGSWFARNVSKDMKGARVPDVGDNFFSDVRKEQEKMGIDKLDGWHRQVGINASDFGL